MKKKLINNSRPQRTKVFLIIFLASLLTSCVTRKQVQYFQELEKIDNQSLVEKKNIKVKPDDRLLIRVLALNEEAAEPFNPRVQGSVGGGGAGGRFFDYQVSKEGTVIFPVLGEVQVEGYTIEELEQLFKEKVSRYLKNPVINVRFANFRITFLGATNGTITVDNDYITLSQAISQLGGINDDGKLDNILIIREENGRRTHHRLDITDADIIESPYYYLQQNDLVYIEPTAVARQNRGYLRTVSNYIGLISSTISLIFIFTR